jgi:hypothetical protein
MFALALLGIALTIGFGVYPYVRGTTGSKGPVGCEVATINFGPVYRFYQDPPVYYQRLDTSLRIGLTNNLDTPIHIQHYSVSALVGTQWVQFKNADSAAFEPYAFGETVPGYPGIKAPSIRRFNLSSNGFDYVMQQTPLVPHEYLELWMFFITGLSRMSASTISQFKFDFDDGAGEQFSCVSPYSLSKDRGIVMGTNTGDLRVLPPEPWPSNMREEPQ